MPLPLLTARNLCQDAALELNLFDANQPIGNDDAVFILGKLNRLFDNWNAEEDAVTGAFFQTFTLTPALAPHTIGPLGTFVTPQRPQAIEAAALLIGAGATTVRSPITIRDAEWWQALPIQGTPGSIPTDLYYDNDWPLGLVNLWPVPTTAYRLELQSRTVLAQLLLTDAFSLAPGYQDAITLTLAESIATPYGTPVPADVAKRATQARARVFKANGETPRLVTADAGMPSGGNAYCYDLPTNVLTQVLTGEATQIGMIDGYFLSFNATLSKIRISDLNNGLVWAVLQFARRTAAPDPWKAMIVNAPDIWLMGEQTSDIWYDAGASPFPLQPRQGLSIPFGIVAPFSLAVTGGSVFWLTRNKDGVGTVVQTKGYSPTKASSYALDTAIAGYQRTATIADAEALVYQKAGHTFYTLRFPSANATWTLDVTTGLWAERGTWKPALNRYDVWSPRVCLYAFGQHLVGGATSTISTLDETFGSEADGTAIRRLRRGPLLINELKRIPIARFELLVEVGLGLQTGQGSDPQILFRGSVDGGKTWGNERQMGAGRAGEYQKRAVVTRLGSPRLWVPEITMTDPIPWRIVDAYFNNQQAA